MVSTLLRKIKVTVLAWTPQSFIGIKQEEDKRQPNRPLRVLLQWLVVVVGSTESPIQVLACSHMSSLFKLDSLCSHFLRDQRGWDRIQFHGIVGVHEAGDRVSRVILLLWVVHDSVHSRLQQSICPHLQMIGNVDQDGVWDHRRRYPGHILVCPRSLNFKSGNVLLHQKSDRPVIRMAVAQTR